MGLFIVLTTLAVSSITHAEVGLKTGAAFTRVKELGKWTSSDWYMGPSIGPYFTLRIAPEVIIEPGILYTKRGAKYRDQPFGPGGTTAVVPAADLRSDHLEFPVLIRYAPADLGSIRPELLVGYAWSMILDSESVSLGIGTEEWTRDSESSFLIGLGASFGPRFGAELLYRLPLSAVGEALWSEDAEYEGISVLARIGL